MDNKFDSNEGIVNISGTITAENMAVGKNATITHGPGTQKDTLQDLLGRMTRLIEELPENKIHEKESLEGLKLLLEKEIKKPEPNPITGKITAQGLVEASKTIGDMSPGLIKTAMAILSFF